MGEGYQPVGQKNRGNDNRTSNENDDDDYYYCVPSALQLSRERCGFDLPNNRENFTVSWV